MNLFISKPRRRKNYRDNDATDNLAYGIGGTVTLALGAVFGCFPIRRPESIIPSRRVII